MNITGLTQNEVEKRKTLGLSNQMVDTYLPSIPKILRRNVLNTANTILVPLVLILASFELWREAMVFGIFSIVNSALASLDEIRTKNRLEKLKAEFQRTAVVIRDGKEKEIPVSEIVKGDFVKAFDGDGIIADGKVVFENYLQTDESILTGESSYVKKDIGDKVLPGSFVVSGECIYEVTAVGSSNYLNKLGSEATRYVEHKSGLQKVGDRFLKFFFLAGILTAVASFFITEGTLEDRLLSLATILAIIIPQTLIFLFTLTFTISVTRMAGKGILVQKSGAIDDISRIDVICMDKTGTITTNNMKLRFAKYFNFNESDIGGFYSGIMDKILSKNKTQQVLNKLFKGYKKEYVYDFEQVPFTSKTKYSLLQGKTHHKFKRIMFGAPEVLTDYLSTKKIKDEIEDFLKKENLLGNRILMGIYFERSNHVSLEEKIKTDKVVIYSIEETLNPGIKNIIKTLTEQDIEVKIISGDSLNSVSKIAEKIGISSDKIVDLRLSRDRIDTLAKEKTIFTRATPEDKLNIIKALQKKGHKVAMVGDGVNDVLGIKLADVGIAMESGSKITRDVSDIVLLKNNYKKIPEIFFEGENIIFNLKMSTKIFFAKAVFGILFANFFTFVLDLPVPILPSSTLIASFLGNTLPSYALSLTRQQVKNRVKFTYDVLSSALPVGMITALSMLYIYYITSMNNFSDLEINTSLIITLLSLSLIYTCILLYTSEKIKSVFNLIILYSIGMIGGILMTVLPLKNIDDENFRNWIVFTVIIFAGVVTYIVKKLGNKNSIVNKYLILVPTIILGYYLLFPFDAYYAVTDVPLYSYLHVLGISCVSVIAILFSYSIEINKLIADFQKGFKK